jgi:hypothetical protein
MRRLLTPLLLVLVLAGLAGPVAANANPGLMFSVMMDDDHLLYRGDQIRDETLKKMRGLGVDYVRVSVLWSVVAEHAKFDKRGKKRRRFRGDNPHTYPAGNWDRYDRLVRAAKTLGVGVYFNVTGPGPRWAHGKAPRKLRRYQRTWKPKAREYFKFVKAVGKRYSGTFPDENDNGAVLPRVGFWSIYNEPNQQGWLTPQWQKRGSETVPWSPVMYRELWYYGRKALNQTGHGKDFILAGETAPLGSGQRNGPSPIYPKRFVRELFCIDANGKPYRGARARRRKCSMLKKIKAFDYTAWGHHPYTKVLAPTKRDRNRDSVTIANINELSALLDSVSAKTGRGPKTNLVAMTEFGYETDPPDPFSGISPAKQAEYINYGDYIAYRDPRVIANTQFLLRDVELIKRFKRTDKRRYFTYQSGLYYADGKPKPAAQAYVLPLVITGTGAAEGYQQAIKLWGWLRFLPPFTDPNNPQKVYLQFRPKGGTQFFNMGEPVPVSNALGFFEAQRGVTGPGTVRAVWIEQFSGTPIYSREIEFAG